MGRFYTIAKLSPRIERTPQGYLLCRDVAVARAGELIYLPHEVPEVRPGADGRVRITRTTDELHDPITLASMEGQPVTLGHPPEFVGPKTWKEYSSGIQVNVRPGDGGDRDKTLADLLITDFEAIQHVEDCQARGELPEISWGYDAAFKDLGGGRGIQLRMRGNHTALVRFGRNGREVAIRDEALDAAPGGVAASRPVYDRAIDTEDNVVDPNPKPSFKERILARLQGRAITTDAVGAVCDELSAEDSALATPVADAFPPPKAKETETAPSASPAAAPAASTPPGPGAPPAAAPGAPGAPAADVIPTWAEALLAAMNKLIETLGVAPAAGEDPAGSTPRSNAPAPPGDENRVEDQAIPPVVDQATAAAAEILCPGITLDANVRQNALRRFAETDEGAATLRAITGGRVLDSLEGDSLDVVFRAASAQVAAQRRAVLDAVARREAPAARKPGDGGPLRLNDVDATKLAEIHRAHRQAA